MSDIAARPSLGSDRAVQALGARAAATLAALCGLGLLWVVGFANADLLHDVAHDTRHSAAFPCH
ncbi:MAG: CbtB domain-containing protein [Gammaproteobacteria bacterium]